MNANEALDRTIRLVRDAVPEHVPDGTIAAAFQGVRIRCAADDPNLGTYSGQTALITLVSLITRMGVQVSLGIPEVPLLGVQPPLHGSHLREALIDYGLDAVPGTSISVDSDGPFDLEFVLGSTPARSAGAYRLTGTKWGGALAVGKTPGRRWDATLPIGAMTAAVLAAPEVFKAAVRRLPLRGGIWPQLLAPCRFTSWDFASDHVILPSQRIELDVISAGAIAQAALFVLLRMPIRLSGRIFDGDVAELSNLNRQMLLRRSDLGKPKVEIASRLSRPFHSCVPVPERLTLETAAQHIPLAPHVLVGVDDIPARWFAQQTVSGWLGVGATSHFEASASSHDGRQACAGCLHPRDDGANDTPIPTVSFVSFWAGLALAVRFLRDVSGSPYEPTKQHLWLSTLRMDEENARLWHPVAARSDCPVGCSAALRLAS